MVEETKADAKKEEKKADKPEESKKAEAPAEGEARHGRPAAAEKAGEKRKKINCLTLVEVENELKTVTEKMGGFQSRYAQDLLLRKKELTSK